MVCSTSCRLKGMVKVEGAGVHQATLELGETLCWEEVGVDLAESMVEHDKVNLALSCLIEV